MPDVLNVVVFLEFLDKLVEELELTECKLIKTFKGQDLEFVKTVCIDINDKQIFQVKFYGKNKYCSNHELGTFFNYVIKSLFFISYS